MSPFPQSDSNAFPAVFLSPPWIIQVAVVLLDVPKYLHMAMLDSWIKCPGAG